MATSLYVLSTCGGDGVFSPNSSTTKVGGSDTTHGLSSSCVYSSRPMLTFDVLFKKHDCPCAK